MMTYRFTGLPFGLTCSPFLLSATIRELADMYKAEFPTATALADNSTFMDDFSSGAGNYDCVTNLYHELVHLMNQIRLPMLKRATNSKHLKEVCRTDGVDFKEVTQTLGIDWAPNWAHSQWASVMSSANTWKALPLRGKSCKLRPDSTTPLGLLSPVSVVGKLLSQDTWCSGFAWDELLPPDLGTLCDALCTEDVSCHDVRRKLCKG